MLRHLLKIGTKLKNSFSRRNVKEPENPILASLKMRAPHQQYRDGKNFIIGFKEAIIQGRKRKRFVVKLVTTYGENSFVCACLQVEHLGPSRTSSLKVRDPNFSKVPFLVEAPLEFGHGSSEVVDIEGFQGVAGARPFLSHFDNVTSRRWAEYLTEVVENNAKATGYTKVRIRDPTTLYSYKHPVAAGDKIDKIWGSAKIAQIRGSMDRVVNGVVEARGYVKEGAYFVKLL